MKKYAYHMFVKLLKDGGAVSDWILAAGLWDDTGFWRDTEVWID